MEHNIPTDFDGLEDDLSAAAHHEEELQQQEEEQATIYWDKCPKCRGTGRVGFAREAGRCFKCGGSGKLPFKTSPEERAAARAQRKQREQRAVECRVDDFTKQHPSEAAWLVAKQDKFDFARSMLEAVRKYGSLTDRQLATVQRLQLQDVHRAEAAAQRVATAKDVQIERIETAFKTARSNGIKRPKLRLSTFKFSLAPDTGRNAGSIYVKQDETYLGKVTGGKFIRSYDCTPEQEREITEVCADPEKAANAYGQRTGVCACCGRELTAAESVNRSIGPICASKYGW